jgi:hypothetical protein
MTDPNQTKPKWRTHCHTMAMQIAPDERPSHSNEVAEHKQTNQTSRSRPKEGNIEPYSV